MNGGYTMRIVRFEEISSTNDYVKEQKKYGENLIVIAKRQTGGRGTKGRSFSSNEGGVYLTKLVFYKNFPAAFPPPDAPPEKVRRGWNGMLFFFRYSRIQYNARRQSPACKTPKSYVISPSRQPLWR